MAMKNIEFFVNRKLLLALVVSTIALRGDMSQAKQIRTEQSVTLRDPLPPTVLDDIESRFRKVSNNRSRLILAAVLFRHGRKSGENYLDEKLKAGDMDSASVFAMNRDETRKKKILASVTISLSHQKKVWEADDRDEDERFEPYFPNHLIVALGRWIDPEVHALLKQICRDYIYEKSLSVALAMQGDKGDIPLLKQSLLKIRHSDSVLERTVQEDMCKASLLHLGVREISGKALNIAIEPDTDDWVKIASILVNIGRLQLVDSQTNLKKFVKWIDANKKNEREREKIRLIIAVVSAVDAVDKVESVKLAKWALQNKADLFVSKKGIETLCRVLMNDEKNTSLVAEELGSWWPSALIQRKKLKEIPGYMDTIDFASYKQLAVSW